MSNLGSFNTMLDKMVNEGDRRPCMFSYECFGFACEMYRNCELRGIIKRGNRRGDVENETDN